MRAAALVLLLALPSCIAYSPLPLDPAPPTGTAVRARLTTTGAVRLSDLFGRPVLNVEGRLLDVSADSLHISLLSATEYGRPWDQADTLALARNELARLDEKQIDALRTGFLVGGLGVVTGAVIVALFKAATQSDTNGQGEPPDATLIPVFSYIW